MAFIVLRKWCLLPTLSVLRRSANIEVPRLVFRNLFSRCICFRNHCSRLRHAITIFLLSNASYALQHMEKLRPLDSRPTSTAHVVAQYYPFSIWKLLYTAASLHILGIMVFAGLSPGQILDLFSRLLVTITRDLQPWYVRRVELPDLLGILGFMVIVIRLMEPAMLTGYVTKRWYFLCILVSEPSKSNLVYGSQVLTKCSYSRSTLRT